MLNLEVETTSVRMDLVLLFTLQAPLADVDRIMAEVVKIVPLAMGKYDSNAFQSSAGIERYQPLECAAAGAETEVRRRPGVVEVSFELPLDKQALERVIEALFRVHSYQEPVIRLQPILSSRSKGLDDTNNPHRWVEHLGRMEDLHLDTSPGR
jgi:hypothetical protein